ncbi:hypothetical protein PIIN_10926, partial [Serendipita indica DSM 11827]
SSTEGSKSELLLLLMDVGAKATTISPSISFALVEYIWSTLENGEQEKWRVNLSSRRRVPRCTRPRCQAWGYSCIRRFRT